MEQNPSRTLFWYFKQDKTLAIRYFIIFNRLETKPYLILAFAIE